MNTEIRAVNIICPHCGKDSFRQAICGANVHTGDPKNIFEACTRTCENCGKKFAIIIKASIKTEI